MKFPETKGPNVLLPANTGIIQAKEPITVLHVVLNCSGQMPNLPVSVAGPASSNRSIPTVLLFTKTIVLA